MSTRLTRVYSDFAGVDFNNEQTLVNVNRSPDALNVWKNYNSNQGKCIETRPGFNKVCNFSDINNYIIYKNKFILHSGVNLVLWSNYPDIPIQQTILFNGANNDKSELFEFNGYLYFLDGINYLRYDGNSLVNVKEVAFVPTTRIGCKPSGGGEKYQAVNFLSDYRINTFFADGESVEYNLDSEGITAIEEVKVNDSIVTNYTVNLSKGKITFTAPPEKDPLNRANVEIKYKKIVPNYSNTIINCRKIFVFDNRVFFYGNSNFKNTFFNSAVSSAEYCADTSKYEDGNKETYIKSLISGNDLLWVFKANENGYPSIFYHVPTLTSNGERIYPRKQGNLSVGCVSSGINFNDDIVFLSKYGLEGIAGNISEEQMLAHRSSNVDCKLVNENNINNSVMCEYMGYLLIAVNNHIYLADSRQKFAEFNSFGYEWYLWELPFNIKDMKLFDNELYINSNSSIYKIGGSSDDNVAINSYWTTRMDNFGYPNRLKTTNKKGGICKIKTIPNGKIKISTLNDDGKVNKILEINCNGFDYTKFTYDNYSYITQNDSTIVYRIKEKKFDELQLKFYSDELDKPFGIIQAVLEVIVGSYIKK